MRCAAPFEQLSVCRIRPWRRLMLVIRDDVDELDRLISDISARRLDAELGRAEAGPVDVNQMLAALARFLRSA